MSNVISDKLKKQSGPVQNVSENGSVSKKPLPADNVFKLTKKKRYLLTVTFGRTWVGNPSEPGKPKGTHSKEDVERFPNLAVLAERLQKLAQPLDPNLPPELAKSHHQPYVVWAGLKEAEYRDKNGDLQMGIVRRAPNVMPSRILPFDIDGAHTSAFNALTEWLRSQKLEFFYYRTASDDETNGSKGPYRRARLVLGSTELFPDVKEACLRLEWHMMQGLGATADKNVWTLPDGTVIKFDRSMSDPAHFAFLPLKGKPVIHRPGNMVEVGELPEVPTEQRKVAHHSKDHDTRMADFNRNPEKNRRQVELVLFNELKEAANGNARSDGSYSWGRICGALGDFIGTEHEEWAADLLVRWSVECGAKWARAERMNRDEQEESVRGEFGRWINPYKTIFALAQRESKEPRPAPVSVTDEDLADEESRHSPVNSPKEMTVTPETQLDYEARVSGKNVVILNTDANLRHMMKRCNIQAALNQMTFDVDVLINGRMVSDPGIYLSHMRSMAAREEVPRDAVNEHLYAIAQAASYHPVRAALHGREWDGVERVADVLACFNFEEPAYAHAVMRKWLISAIAAVFADNFEAKLVPVLVSKDQSLRKTSAIVRIASLVDNALIQELPDPKDRDSLRRGVGHWIAEWAELETLSKRDTGMMKNFISRRVDHYRKPYGHGDVNKPRQTVFIGSANRTDFLQDKTGNVRFAPVEITKRVDIDKMNSLLGWKWKGVPIRDNPDELLQFWLEIKTWFDAGESWHMTDDLTAQQSVINQKYTAASNIEILVNDWIGENESAVRKWKNCKAIAADLGLPSNLVQQLGHVLKSRDDVQHKDRGTKGCLYLWPVAGADDRNDLED